MRRFSLVVFASSILAIGCGADVNDVDPRVVPGGGIGDGDIEGELNVHVIDSLDDSPVAGATVLVGEPGDTPLEGDTDSTGLIVFTGDSLSGPETITVVTDDYVVTTWFGANGANVTIPIEDATPLQSQIPQATLSGTITGWEDIPVGANPVLAIIGYSQDPALDDAENNLDQGGGVGLPQNVCAKSSINPNAPCDWVLDTRTGDIALYAIIVELDTNGTPTDDTDDIITQIGSAFELGVSVEDGQDQQGFALEMIDTGDLASVTVNIDPNPPGLTNTGVILGLDTGTDGIMNVGVSFSGELSFTVPDLVGPFAGMTYQVIGFAGEQDNNEDDQPGSIVIDRGFTSLGTIDLSPWLDLAGELDQVDGEFSFDPVPGAVFHGAGLFDSSNNQVWSIAIFDGRESFSLPAVDPDPLPSSGVDFTVGAFDGDVNLRDLELETIFEKIDRFSNARTNDIL